MWLRKTFHRRRVTSRDARIAERRSSRKSSPCTYRAVPHTLSIPWIIRDTTNRGKAFTNHRYFRVATGAVYYRDCYRGLERPPYFYPNESPSHDGARLSPLQVRIFIQLCVTRGHYRVWLSVRSVTVCGRTKRLRISSSLSFFAKSLELFNEIFGGVLHPS